MTTYQTIGRDGIRRHRCALAAVHDWRERRRTEPDDVDGAPPCLDQMSPRGIVRIWHPHDRPPGIGHALREALALAYRRTD